MILQFFMPLEISKMLNQSMASTSLTHSDISIITYNSLNFNLILWYFCQILYRKSILTNVCVSWNGSHLFKGLTRVGQTMKNSFEMEQNIQTSNMDFNSYFLHKVFTKTKSSRLLLLASSSLELNLMNNLPNQLSISCLFFISSNGSCLRLNKQLIIKLETLKNL